MKLKTMNLTAGNSPMMEMSESPTSEKRYIPKMINIDSLMDLTNKERKVMTSLITSNSSMSSEIRVMLETKGIITNISE
tara:strand:+ start:778 stop:1014 length:237 start_codon:yes stop_codon:yes gene_type:complete